MPLTTWRTCCDSRWPGAHTSLCRETRMTDISDEEFLQLLIKDPSWCVFYHNQRVVDLLPILTKGYIKSEKKKD